MNVFLTGATGFIGSYLVKALIRAGHHVIGLTRSDAGARALTLAGAEVFFADVNDLESLRVGASAADAVIHAAFNHDASTLVESSEADRRIILTFGEVLAGTPRPLLISSGTGLARSKTGGSAVETDDHVTFAQFPRAASEEAADTVIAKGGHVIVMRLPQVHDQRRQGRIAHHIALARRKGRVAYVGDGENRLLAVHVSDAVRLYRLALEKGKPGARYHAVAEGLKLPVESITTEAAADYFGWLATLAAVDLAATSVLTRQDLGWDPVGPDLLTDLRTMDYGLSEGPAAAVKGGGSRREIGASLSTPLRRGGDDDCSVSNSLGPGVPGRFAETLK